MAQLKHVCGKCKKSFGPEADLRSHVRGVHKGQRVTLYVRFDIMDVPDRKKEASQYPTASAAQIEPDWSRKCTNCDNAPIVPVTGLCGPCTWGDAETAGGNW